MPSYKAKLYPYTITILPDFCISYGRKLVDSVIAAVGYVIGGHKTVTEAALGIDDDCNEKTVMRYFGRVVDRIKNWNVQLALYLTGTLRETYIPDKKQCNPERYHDWVCFMDLIERIETRESELQGFAHHYSMPGYVLAIIGRANPALGP